MKIRLGFVANSSSSAFILAYNEENVVSDIWNQLHKSFGAVYAGECLGYIIDYLERAENKADNLDEFFDYLATNLRWEVDYEYRVELEEKGMNYSETHEISRSDEGRKEIERRVQERVNKIKEAVKGFDTVKRIEIPDDYDVLRDLEQHIIKNLKECKDVKDCH